MFNIICSFIIGTGICLTARLIPVLNLDKVMIGDIMLLIPGIAMTNAIRDIIMGDTVSGTMRLVESTINIYRHSGGTDHMVAAFPKKRTRALLIGAYRQQGSCLM